MNTNSIILSEDDKMCKRFADCNVGVSFSIDGADKESHEIIRGKATFEKIIIAAKKYAKATKNSSNIVRAFYFTLTPDNKNDDFEILFQLARECGINNIVVGVMIPLGYGEKNYDGQTIYISELLSVTEQIINISKDYPEIRLAFPYQTPLLLKYMNCKTNSKFGLCYSKCKSAFCEFSMEPDGTLFPCIYVNDIYNNTGKDLRTINNINKYDIEEIVSNEFFTYVKRELDNRTKYNDIEPCSNCPYNNVLGLCRPCSFENGKRSNQEFHRNMICEYILKMNNYNFYFD